MQARPESRDYQSSRSKRQVAQSLALPNSSTDPHEQPVHVPRERERRGADLRGAAGVGLAGQLVCVVGVPLLHSILSPGWIAPPQVAQRLAYFAVIVMVGLSIQAALRSAEGRQVHRPPS